MFRALFFFFSIILLASPGKAAEYSGQWLPTPKMKVHDGDQWSIATRGRVQIDAVKIRDDETEQSGGIKDRRLRIGLEGNYGRNWGFIIERDFADDEDGEFTDIELHYDDLVGMQVKAGHFTEPFGMERINSNLNTLFMERAVLDAFAPKRGVGARVTGYNEQASLSFGIFTDSFEENSNKDEYGMTGRATYAFPLTARHGLLHLGIAGSYREMEQISFAAYPDTPLTDQRSVASGRVYDAENLVLTGLEAAYSQAGLIVEAEYMRADISRRQAADATPSGWYVQAAWLLTGEGRGYSPADEAVFGSVKPAAPFNLEHGGWGAWELAARYQVLDVTDGSLDGGTLRAATGGINWYANANWRVTGDITYAFTDEQALVPNDDPVIMGLRLQVRM